MAKDLKIKKCWFHGGKFPHYDIPKKMLKEVEKNPKCVKVSSRTILKIIKMSKI